ncbi:MAG: hypothetical protein K2X71_18150 [Methylobacterium sp.]|uniref:hypothetical protein n=1 Tax=Methylobacterium sp. TaxID=409 RepID=UPI00258625AE|nr:hypothetical protein [Methylobacterium sp.]MBY0297929.1 hypothetical protein [Methylobacterium sp.]
MRARSRPPRSPRLRATLPWLVLGLGLAAATSPAWRPLAFGVSPSLDALLALRCTPPG